MINFTNRFLNYGDFRRYGDAFVETGSAAGDGIQRALDAGFEHIYSIEAFEPSFEICKNRFFSQGNNPKVNIFLGLSRRLLPQILDQVGKRCVIFLDAHPSGAKSYGHKELMAGKVSYAQDTIIREELEILLRGSHQHVIILDDVNGDKPTSSVYVQMILDRFPGYTFAFYDENLSGNRLYQNKLLVAIPGE